MTDYFLIASLPMIRPDAPPPLTPEAFRARCSDRLGASDVAVIDALLADQPANHPFARAWRNADIQVRNAIARARAAKRRQDATPWLQAHEGYDLSIVEGVEAAFRQTDPRRRELALDALRNRLIDDLQGPDAFGSAALPAYAVKLALAWRRHRFDPEAGSQRLDDALQAAGQPDVEEG